LKSKIKVKNKRGIPFESRILISALMILLQIAVFFMMMYSLSTKLLWIYSFIEFLSMILAVYIINSHTNPSYKLPWTTFILIAPLVGVPAYLFWGGGRVFPPFRRKMKKSEAHYLKYLPESDDILAKLEYEDIHHSKQAHFLKTESGFPLYANTSAEYLSPGEVFLPRLLEELEGAREFIFIEFFILAEGKMWSQIYEILRRKAAQGVEVKVIFDDFGSIKRQHKGFVNRLRRNGISVAIFNKIRPSIDMFMNNRNHRKIVIIDGHTAFTGGINIADEYINHIERFGYWMDCGIMLKGDAVLSFTVMFMSMWTFTTGQVLNGDRYAKRIPQPHDGFVLPYCDSPLNDRDPAEGIYMQMISSAQRYIYITTPYLIINNSMIDALCLAAKSGIDVRIVTPKIGDKGYVHPVTQQNYEPLLAAGVRIYEYTPGFIHSKIFVSDDHTATIGTVNMDYRSFYTHFECGAWLCSNNAIIDIKSHLNSILEKSEEIKLEKWRKRPLLQKLKQHILHLFAPLL